MSTDIRLSWPCPHLTIEEVVSLGEDNRSLDTRQPVAGSGTVRILVNDELFIPQTGWYSAAQLYSSIAGPYDLIGNENELSIETSAGLFSIALSISGTSRWTTARVIQALKANGFDIGLLESINSRLVISDSNNVGTKSFVKISGTAASALGFGTTGNNRQRQARGQKVYPAWRLHVRDDDIVNRFPRFDERIKNAPIFKVTYTVPVNRCLRCKATHFENDYRFTNTGAVILIDNEDLLYQATLKVILTDKGSNPYHPGYGTSITSRIGSKALSSTAAIVSDEIRRALTNYQKLQQEQGQYQVVTPKERLYSLLDINVAPHKEDPTTFLADVVVQNASGEPINLSIVFTVPGVVALMGSNGLIIGS